MKLNLLPTYVSKEKQTKVAVVVSLLLAIAGIVAAVFMVIIPQNTIADLDGKIQTESAEHARLMALSRSGDEILNRAQMIIRNTALADDMLAHSARYPDLYDDVRQYIPSFFRVTSMSAVAAGDQASQVTITGVLRTYQQYADLMLALLKNPEVMAVTRSGFQNPDPIIPPLTPEDQRGRARGPNDPSIPDDPLARLDQLIAQGGTTGFTGTGNFGTDEPDRGAMPDWSTVTVQLVVRRPLQAPDVSATLQLQRNAPRLGGGAPPAQTTP